MQHHIGVLMDGTLRVASDLLNQPMQPPGSTSEGSCGEASRQQEHAAASDAIALEGTSQTLLETCPPAASVFLPCCKLSLSLKDSALQAMELTSENTSIFNL